MNAKPFIAASAAVVLAAWGYYFVSRRTPAPADSKGAKPVAEVQAKHAFDSVPAKAAPPAKPPLAETEPDPVPAASPAPSPYPFLSGPQATATILVQWADTHQPAAGTSVTLTGTVARQAIDWKRSAIADREGKVLIQYPEAFDWVCVATNHPDGAQYIKNYVRRGEIDMIYAKGSLPYSDPIVIDLNRGGRIAGTVRRADNGQPVAGVRVQCFEESLAGTAISGPDGRYSVRGLPEGLCRIEAASLAFNAGLETVQRRFPVKAGAESGPYDIPVSPSASVSGFISDRITGAPLPGATVRVDSLSGISGIVAVSHADGSYRLPNIPSGLVKRIVASHPGYSKEASIFKADSGGHEQANFALAPGGRLEAVVKDPKGAPIAAALVISGESQALTDGNGVALLQGLAVDQPPTIWAYKPGYHDPGALSIRSSFDAQNVLRAQSVLTPIEMKTATYVGTVHDSEGKPLGGVEIGFSNFYKYTDGHGGSVKSAADGSYRLGPVSAGETPTLHAWAKGLALLVLKAPPSANPAIPAQIDFTMESAQILAGRVVDEKGEPISGARVDLSSYVDIRPDPRLDQLARSIVGATTGVDGKFAFEDMPNSLWAAAPSAPGYSQTPWHLDPYKNGADLVLLKLGILRGRVVDADTKRPINRFRISKGSSRSSPESMATTSFDDPSGRFVLSSLDRNQAERVVIESDGYVRLERSNVLGAKDDAPETVLELKKAKMLRIEVTDRSSGAPIPGASILFGESKVNYNPKSTFSASNDIYSVAKNVTNLFADATGSAAFPDTGAQLIIRIRAAGYSPIQLFSTNRSQPGAERIAAGLDPAATIGGRVQVDGKDAVNSSVFIESAKQGPDFKSIATRTDAAGRYLVEGLSSGDYIATAHRAKADGKDEVAFVRKAKVAGRTATTLNLGVDLGDSALFGIIANGKIPLPGIRVQLTPLFDWDYTSFGATSDKDGVFRIYGLRPGDYRLGIRIGPVGYQLGLKTDYVNYQVDVGPEPTERDFDMTPGHAVKIRPEFANDFPPDLRGQIYSGVLAFSKTAPAPARRGIQVDSRIQAQLKDGILSFNGRFQGTYRLSLKARQNQFMVFGDVVGAGLAANQEIEIDRDLQIDNLESDVDLGTIAIPYGRARLLLKWATPGLPRPERLELVQFPPGLKMLSYVKSVAADPSKDDQALLGVQMGEHEYRLFAPGYAVVPDVLKATVGDGAIPDLIFELHPETLIHGSVLAPEDTSGSTIHPSRVVLAGPSGDIEAKIGSMSFDGLVDMKFGRTGRVAEGSWFAFHAVPEGTYTLKVEADGYRTTSTQVQAKMGTATELKIYMRQ